MYPGRNGESPYRRASRSRKNRERAFSAVNYKTRSQMLRRDAVLDSAARMERKARKKYVSLGREPTAYRQKFEHEYFCR